MPELAVYSLDASALIEAWSRYPLGVFPALWDRVAGLCNDSRMLMSEEVLREIKAKDEDLMHWIKVFTGRAVMTSPEIQVIVSELLESYPNFVNLQSSRSGGDPFVVAVAIRHQAIVVTAERRTGNLNGPKIPDVCEARNVRWIRFLDLLRQEGWQF